MRQPDDTISSLDALASIHWHLGAAVEPLCRSNPTISNQPRENGLQKVGLAMRVQPLSPYPMRRPESNLEICQSQPNKALLSPINQARENRRGASLYSDCAPSVYSSASASLDVREDLRTASLTSDPMMPTTTPTSTAAKPARTSPLQVGQIRLLSLDKVDKQSSSRGDGLQITASQSVSATDVDPIYQSHLRIGRINFNLIKEGLTPEVWIRSPWKVGLHRQENSISPVSSRPSEDAGTPFVTVASSDDKCTRVILKPPTNLAKHRKKSTSVLSLIPHGPLLDGHLESLLAAQHSFSEPSPNSRESRGPNNYHTAISPAVPIIPPLSSPFSPPIINEPVQFSVVNRRIP
ncbi:hypothetical protein NP233_g9956 [Leucocoprinus birnbaumii]|uniref:Uncharacterized protein n=1 Tax=Leucocoprinus birnbaumii TaxID=56174 RepID=A0AAD5VK74_9AGAR|nr:hypothetical protein NP233_g9956 [Leucocoprinus birnbaumii]